MTRRDTRQRRQHRTKAAKRTTRAALAASGARGEADARDRRCRQDDRSACERCGSARLHGRRRCVLVWALAIDLHQRDLGPVRRAAVEPIATDRGRGRRRHRGALIVLYRHQPRLRRSRTRSRASSRRSPGRRARRPHDSTDRRRSSPRSIATVIHRSSFDAVWSAVTDLIYKV